MDPSQLSIHWKKIDITASEIAMSLKLLDNFWFKITNSRITTQPSTFREIPSAELLFNTSRIVQKHSQDNRIGIAADNSFTRLKNLRNRA